LPLWIPESAIRAIHEELVTEHGGLAGAPDGDLLGATLARPQNLFAYADPPPSLYQLAAAYGFAFAKNHCFNDGNKRVALAAIDVFLQLNGYELTAPEPEAVKVIQRLAASKLTEADLALWIEDNVKPSI
jgi:death on curing protein